MLKGSVSGTGLLKGSISAVLGRDGDSAYQIALKQGFVGTEAEWLASLKGEPGKGLDIKGTYATLSALQTAVKNPEKGDMYNVGSTPPYTIYMYDSEKGWVSQGRLQGENGVTFTPSVSSSGELSWKNDGGLENPPSVNIKGDKGDAFEYSDFTADQLAALKGENGESGVYVGTGDMPDGYNVQIDPDGDSFDAGQIAENIELLESVDWIATKTEVPSLTDVWSERTMVFSNNLTLNPKFKAQVGQEYFVYWNGVEYRCVAKYCDDAVYIGNGTLVHGTMVEDTGEPFCLYGIFFDPETVAYLNKVNGEEVETVKMSVAARDMGASAFEYNKMPPEYLPDCVVKSVNGATPDENGNVTVGAAPSTEIAERLDQLSEAIADKADKPTYSGGNLQIGDDITIGVEWRYADGMPENNGLTYTGTAGKAVLQDGGVLLSPGAEYKFPVLTAKTAVLECVFSISAFATYQYGFRMQLTNGTTGIRISCYLNELRFNQNTNSNLTIAQLETDTEYTLRIVWNETDGANVYLNGSQVLTNASSIYALDEIDIGQFHSGTTLLKSISFSADGVAKVSSINGAEIEQKISDVGGYFASDTVEGALQEIGAELAGVATLLGSGVFE